MYSIEDFKSLNNSKHLVITQHSRKRFAERGITVQDIIYTIQTGEIIEAYPTDTPFPSCLILGYSGERALHVCASIDSDLVYVIMAYSPDPAKWEADWKTRKEAKA